MKHISTKLALAFFGMAALAVALIWLVQAVFLSDSYLNQRVKSIDAAVAEVAVASDTDYAALERALNVSLLAVNGSGSSNSNNNQNNQNNQNGNGQNGNGNGNGNSNNGNSNNGNGNDSNGYGNNDYGNGGFSDPFGLW